MKSAPVHTPDHAERHRRQLLEKRDEVINGLGMSLEKDSLGYAQLRLVEEALQRLDSGCFGICFSCRRRITAQRLRALPWVRHCQVCQESLGGASGPE